MTTTPYAYTEPVEEPIRPGRPSFLTRCAQAVTQSALDRAVVTIFPIAAVLLASGHTSHKLLTVAIATVCWFVAVQSCFRHPRLSTVALGTGFVTAIGAMVGDDGRSCRHPARGPARTRRIGAERTARRCTVGRPRPDLPRNPRCRPAPLRRARVREGSRPPHHAGVVHERAPSLPASVLAVHQTDVRSSDREHCPDRSGTDPPRRRSPRARDESRAGPVSAG